MKVVKDARLGFTLIELLVVIAIIAILAAILFPVFSRARDKAQQAACISNLKQVGQAMGLYVDDYDETFPRHPYENVACPADVLAKMHWRAFVTNLFIPYVKNLEVFLCEKGPKRAGSNAANYACPMPPQYLCNYAFNYVILDDPGVGLTPGFSGRLANIQAFGFTTAAALAPTAFGATLSLTMKRVTSASGQVGGQLTGTTG
jgi:prepilin-type N-terminal cleavage/methylation domain-containing protein